MSFISIINDIILDLLRDYDPVYIKSEIDQNDQLLHYWYNNKGSVVITDRYKSNPSRFHRLLSDGFDNELFYTDKKYVSVKHKSVIIDDYQPIPQVLLDLAYGK